MCLIHYIHEMKSENKFFFILLTKYNTINKNTSHAKLEFTTLFQYPRIDCYHVFKLCRNVSNFVQFWILISCILSNFTTRNKYNLFNAIKLVLGNIYVIFNKYLFAGNLSSKPLVKNKYLFLPLASKYS